MKETEKHESISRGNTCLLPNGEGQYVFGCEVHVDLPTGFRDRLDTILPARSGIRTVTYASFSPVDALKALDPNDYRVSHDYLRHLMKPATHRPDEVSRSTLFQFGRPENTISYLLSSRVLLWESARSAFRDVMTSPETTRSRILILNAHGGYYRKTWSFCDGLGYWNTKRTIGSVQKQVQAIGIQTQPVRSSDLSERNVIPVETAISAYIRDYPDTAAILIMACNMEHADLSGWYDIPIFYLHGTDVQYEFDAKQHLLPPKNTVMLKHQDSLYEFVPQPLHDGGDIRYW